MSRLDELIAKYNEYVCRDHHKDRDCHFSIDKIWSYGVFAGYIVRHYGYVNELRSPTFSTYADAESWLISKLEELTKPEEWEWQE